MRTDRWMTSRVTTEDRTINEYINRKRIRNSADGGERDFDGMIVLRGYGYGNER